MKRFSRLLCLLLCLCFAGCSAAAPASSSQPAAPASSPDSSSALTTETLPVIGVIECPWVLDISAVDAALVETAFADPDSQSTVICCKASDAESLVQSAEDLLTDGAQVLIVSLPSADAADKVIDLCQPVGASVIFTGAQPSAAAMQKYDKCWYIGMLCEQTGELLGKAVAEDFKNGVIPDANADGLLQYAWFGGDTAGGGELHYRYCMQSCDDMGVFSAEIFSKLTACGEQAGYAMAQNLLGISILPSEGSTDSSQPEEVVDIAPASYPLPEAVLCSDSATARGAVPLLAEAGVYVACVAFSEADAQSLEEMGIHAPTWLPRDQVTEYAVDFARNILQGRHVTLDTGLYLDDSRQSLVSAGDSRED